MNIEPAKTFPLLNVRVSAVTFEDALGRLLHAPMLRQRFRTHFCSVHMLVEASRDGALQAALNADEALVVPDGMPLVWMGRQKGYRVERVCGIDMLPALLDRSRDYGYRHFFYGGAPGVPERLADTMRRTFPDLQVAGTFSPPFRPLTPEEDAAIVARINAAAPDYVWVGISTPKQDYWVTEHRHRLEAPVLLAVGAAFDFHSGVKRRAPGWMQRSGTEWLFRLISEPRRLWRRYAYTNSYFLYTIARDALATRARSAVRS
jgi:N-acetylglucosaminyldiphosphoundecaprenol N-acetyl-beta-D-mannosaminyltransferase